MTHSFRCEQDAALVTTARGKVKGYAYDGVLVFKGIPYAKARRFHRPEPAAPWEGVLDAVSYGYVCPLLGYDRPNGELFVPHRYWPADEDCLNLNLWTPAADSGKRPVLFWLHGGGFEAGSAIEHIAYDGANMARLGDAVVVTVNHRLNLLGYFDLSDYGPEYENSGNAGGDDIIAALRWVRENIAAFGGDPDNVTVFGQSGGGGKVTALLQSPEADGLYARGIVMSGVLGSVLPDVAGSGKPMAEALMAELGLSGVGELESAAGEGLPEAEARTGGEGMQYRLHALQKRALLRRPRRLRIPPGDRRPSAAGGQRVRGGPRIHAPALRQARPERKRAVGNAAPCAGR